ncbi:glycosyltransferase [Salinibacter ruber]|uniref:Poly(Glycerol-phosphate) alpha-glucosyltransferase n=1 Tax=Salinibacter ruber TaxID=146919 RepID=A0A9X2V7J0_9BACT|nr:glycosyltransferase [Salinibacter ruber]MCS4122715.1 poly(glycerol-phosphate) alpha-glucosyltransferase [Salinibacter ruber]
MKTTILTPSLSRQAGGIFEAERRLSQALHRLPDVEIEVVGLRDEKTTADLPDWAPLTPTVLPTWGPEAFGYSPDLVNTLLGTDADLLHLHALWMYTTVAALQWRRATQRPHVVSVHGMLDSWAVNNAEWKKQIVGWLYEHRSLRQAACLHALNDEEYEAIRDYGLETPVCVVPNGVDLPGTAPDRAPPWAETGVPEGDRVLLFLGRLHPKKGLSELLAAWEKVEPNGWHLAIIGWDDGGHEAVLQDQATEAGLTDRVHFLGPRFGEEKGAAFHHADAFILPSHSEGLPMAVLEAWSYRLPVLMTPACNLSEGFRSGAALSIEPSAQGIADGLGRLLDRTFDEWREMGEKGRALVEQSYTWPQIARTMREVYRWVLGEGPRPDCVYVD